MRITQLLLKMIYRYQIWKCNHFHSHMTRPQIYPTYALSHCMECGREIRTELVGPYPGYAGNSSDDWEEMR